MCSVAIQPLKTRQKSIASRTLSSVHPIHAHSVISMKKIQTQQIADGGKEILQTVGRNSLGQSRAVPSGQWVGEEVGRPLSSW
jgi:L-arabinose isomerase